MTIYTCIFLAWTWPAQWGLLCDCSRQVKLLPVTFCADQNVMIPTPQWHLPTVWHLPNLARKITLPPHGYMSVVTWETGRWVKIHQMESGTQEISGWETKQFWHLPELGGLLHTISLYKIPLAQACFPLARPNFHSHWRVIVSQPGYKKFNIILMKFSSFLMPQKPKEQEQ